MQDHPVADRRMIRIIDASFRSPLRVTVYPLSPDLLIQIIAWTALP
jgi:hypothetical protein